MVVEIMVGNESANQKMAFDRKSLEYDCMLIRSEGHLGGFKISIEKQFDEWLQR